MVNTYYRASVTVDDVAEGKACNSPFTVRMKLQSHYLKVVPDRWG